MSKKWNLREMRYLEFPAPEYVVVKQSQSVTVYEQLNLKNY